MPPRTGAIMSEQLVMLLSDTPIARRTDPVTSHLAACEVTRSGKRGAQQRLVHNYVVKFPGHTSQELAEICQQHGGALDRYDFARRLPELASERDIHGNHCKAFITRGMSKRLCRITGKLATVWYPA